MQPTSGGLVNAWRVGRRGIAVPPALHFWQHAISGAGAAATNTILNRTNAYVEDSILTTTALAGDVLISATDTSTIEAVVAAVAAAVGGGGTGVGSPHQ